MNSGATLALTALMRRTRSLSLAVLCALPVALGGAAAAHANAFDTVITGYKKDGTVNPCKYSSDTLKKAKAGITNDVQAYAPDFADLVDAALKARASGACDTKQKKSSGTAVAPATTAPTGGGTSTGGTPSAAPATTAGTTAAAPATTAAAPTPQPTPSVKPAPAVSDGAILAAANADAGDSGVPAPLIALAIVLALAALASTVVLLTRFLALEPRWLVRSRHATAEAGWRTSAAWAEFTDWLRLGR